MADPIQNVGGATATAVKGSKADHTEPLSEAAIDTVIEIAAQLPKADQQKVLSQIANEPNLTAAQKGQVEKMNAANTGATAAAKTGKSAFIQGPPNLTALGNVSAPPDAAVQKHFEDLAKTFNANHSTVLDLSKIFLGQINSK